MRKALILLLLTTLTFYSCQEGEEKHVEEDLTDIIKKDKDENGTLTIENAESQGVFKSGAHTTTGTVTIVKNGDVRSLVFENFKTDPGPDLDVYLVPKINSTDYINLGELKGTSGSFSYQINQEVDFSKYKFVSIWCVKFSVNFGHAELKQEQ